MLTPTVGPTAPCSAVPTVKRVIENDSDASEGPTPLHCAAMKRYDVSALLLIRNGVEVAAMKRYDVSALLLIRNGVEVAAAQRDQATPLHLEAHGDVGAGKGKSKR
ncbi:hypothetical protein FN846DRAFT_908468 [Sphaerosporella brunnea]|uniref:Uncharacterized protein n=1 Tax=Sphaerosporella brunnea TaxID=1250544 RepID=A0A5J5ETB5_9PEZI|nr:hypothetical protein FN846DRAFT_908468 [Sphaerosporella brunnea]